MADIDIDGLVRDPDFQGRPFKVRMDILKEADPQGFGTLDTKSQAQMLNDMKSQDWWQGGANNKTKPAPIGGVAIGSPEHRRMMADFIRTNAARDFKQEAVRGLPMGNRLADASMGTYNDPVHPERTVNAVLGPQVSPTTGGAMVQGLSNLMSNPGPQIEGAIAFPSDFATGAINAVRSPEKGSIGKFAKETVKGVAAPLGLADLASGDLSFPEARNAWENNFLGSGLVGYGVARGGASLADLATGKMVKPTVQTALPPEAVRQMELAALSQQHNVPLTVGELRGSTGLKAAETQLERVPAVGIRGFRKNQSTALKNAAESLVDNLTTGVDDSGIAIQQGLLNKMNAGKKLAKQAYDRIDEAMTKKGVVDEIAPEATRQAAKDLLGEYPDIFDRLPSGTVKSKLQIITQDAAPKTIESSILDAQGNPITSVVEPTMSFKDARTLREQLGNYIDRARKSAGAVGDKEVRRLAILKSAVDADINAWAESSPHAEINSAFRAANKVYQDNVAPFKEFIVKKATGDTFDTDLMAKTFIKNDRPQLAAKLMNLLDDSGKAAVKHSILREALDLGLETKADVPFSPAKFANKMERYGKTLNSIFSPEELTQINGFVKLARAAERAGQYAENPPTGLRAGDLGIFTGFGYGLATNPLATIGTAAALKSLSSLLTSEFGRRMLTRSAKIKEGTPAWNSFINYVNDKMGKGGGSGSGDNSTSQTPRTPQRPGNMDLAPGPDEVGSKQLAGEVSPADVSPSDSAKIDKILDTAAGKKPSLSGLYKKKLNQQ